MAKKPTPIGAETTPPPVAEPALKIGVKPDYKPRKEHTQKAWGICQQTVAAGKGKCTITELKLALHYKLADGSDKDHEDFIAYMVQHQHLEHTK